jgi:hypothetical protein
MRRAFLLLVAALLFVASGCGSDRDRGINSNKDKPRTVDRAE